MSWYNALAAGVTATSGFLGTLAANRYNARENRRARDYNLKMWKMENEYNSPASQMQRFKDAGLNPNLIYGQGNPGNAGSIPSAVGAHANPVELDLPSAVAVVNGLIEANTRKEILEKEKWQVGQEKERYINSYLTNDVLFGIDRPNVTAFGKGRFGIVEGYVGDKRQKSWFEKMKDTELALANKLLEIRSAEAGMGQSLKGWNLTAADSWIARVAAKFLEDTKWDKYRRK